MVIITKLEAAHRQLTTAIRMHFDDDDVAAIHTLVCAAREIYEKHCEVQGVERMFEMIEASRGAALLLVGSLALDPIDDLFPVNRDVGGRSSAIQ